MEPKRVISRILIQLEGGNGLNLSNVRGFAHVIENGNAVIGIMIAQKEPTSEMKLVAEKLGYADWPGNKKYPRCQILTVEQILEHNAKPDIPESYRITGQAGVGKKVEAGQEGFEF